MRTHTLTKTVPSRDQTMPRGFSSLNVTASESSPPGSPKKKNHFLKPLLAVLILAAAFLGLNARASNEAIPFYAIDSNAPVNFFTNGVGFEFVPDQNITVNSLGYNGLDLANSPYLVSLYNGSGNLLASTVITTGSTLFNQTLYNSIGGVNLLAGTTNYIGAAELTGNDWIGNTVGAAGNGTFTVNPDINYITGVSDFIGGLPQADQGDNFHVDENFQFTVVPEPTVLGQGALGLLLLFARRFWRR